MIFSFYDNYLLFYFYFLIYKIKIILVLKTYKIFKEGLLNKLEGPSDEEVWNNLKKLSPNNIFAKSCENGFFYGVKKSMEMGADIFSHFEYENDWNDDYSGLEYLIKNNNLDIFKYIFDIYEIKDYQQDELNSTLAIAVYYGNIVAANILLDNGAKTNSDEYSMLDIAVDKNVNNSHYNVIELLLKYGADIHSNNNYAIKKAKQKGYTEIIDLFNKYDNKIKESLLNKLEGPSDDEFWDFIKNLPINEILKKSIKAESIKYILYALEEGASIKELSFFSLKKLLSLLEQNNKKDLLYDILDEYYENIYGHGDDVNTYFLFSCFYGYMNGVIKSINKYKIDILTNSMRGFEFAIKYNHLEILEFLLNKSKYLIMLGRYIIQPCLEFAEKYNNEEAIKIIKRYE